MVRFVHCSIKGDIISKDTFKKPNLNVSFCETHKFNLTGAFYLSKVDDDNPESSMWVRHRKILHSHTDYYLKTEEGLVDGWLTGTKTYLDLDFTKHKIYVVDTPNDLKQLFLMYGRFSQQVEWELGRSTKETHNLNQLRFEKLKDLRVLNQFINSLDPEYLAQLRNPEPKTADKFARLIASRNIRNMPLVSIKNQQVNIPKKGITCEFLVDLLRTQQKWETLVADPSDLRISTVVDSLDFRKIANDGYNGIYYSTNLVKFNELADEDMTGKPLKKYVDWCNFITQPDIGELPEFMEFLSDDDKKEIKDEIEYYIRWLGSDTLMIWDWPEHVISGGGET